MRLGEDRISHISHLILNGIIAEELIEPLQAEEKLLREIKHSITAELQYEDEADAVARRKIQTMSRKIPEGSAEWTVLHRKFLEEELRRRKRL